MMSESLPLPSTSADSTTTKGSKMVSIPASNAASSLTTPLAIPPNPTTGCILETCSILETDLILETDPILETDSPPPKRYKPTPSFAKIKIPKTSPFRVYSVEEEQRATALDDTFVSLFEEKCIVRARVPERFEATFPVDIWREILDHVYSLNDLFSLCLTSSNLYHLTIPRLYSTLTIRSPFYHGEVDDNAQRFSPRNLIPLDVILPPFIPKGPTPAKGRKRLRFSSPEIKLSPPLIPLPKWQMLRFVKDLRIEKWEGWRSLPRVPKPLESGYLYSNYKRGEKQIVVQTALRPEGVAELHWVRGEDRKYLRLQSVLAKLLRDMVMLELFTYNPQRYLSTPPIFEFPPNPLSVPTPPALAEDCINGITPELFAALKALPNLKGLMINFHIWDPLESNFQLAPLAYRPHKAGLIGFKSLEELVLLGVSADGRFSEVEIVVRDCLFSKSGRRLNRLEVRIEREWYEELQAMNLINPTQDLWDWAVSLWGRCFGAAESFRCARSLNSTHINVLLEFGPIKWHWNCPVDVGFICRSEHLTTLNLKNVHPKQILGAIKKLTKMETPSLKVFAVECRLIALNKFLRRFCGLKELYIFEPEAEANNEARDILWVNRESSFQIAGAAQQKPTGSKGAQWTLDTIYKCHLRTLEVLVIEEIIYPPRLNCSGATINSIGGWRERGTNLKELGVCLWGAWEHIAEFLTAFEGLKSLHIFNRHRSDAIVPVQGIPMYLQTVPQVATGKSHYFYNAETTALRIANLWGRDLICARKKVRPGMLDFDRWIGVGPHFLEIASDWRWKWKIDDAGKYVNWEDGPEFVGNAKTRVWEEGGKMWKVLREGEVLTRDDDNYLFFDG